MQLENFAAVAGRVVALHAIESPDPRRSPAIGNLHLAQQEVRSALVDAAHQPAQRMPPQVHPLGHHPQRLALNQPSFERIEVMAGWTHAHCPQLPVPLDNQAVLPDPDHRELPLHWLQGQVVGGGQFEGVPVGSRLALILLTGDVKVAQQGLQAIAETDLTERE